MAELSQLENALVKADAAGDVESARALATEIRRVRATPGPSAAPPRGTVLGATYEGMADVAGAPVDLVNLGVNALTAPTRMAPSIFGQGIPKINNPFLGSDWWKERLGVKDQIKNVAYTAGGEATDAMTRMGASPETAAKVGFASNVATQAIPAILGGQVGKLASPSIEAGSRRLMQSAVKPSTDDLLSGDAKRAIDTMLAEGINVSQGGIQKLQQKISQLNGEIRTAIANSPATVDKQAVGRELLGTLDRFRRQVNPNADLKQIRDSWVEFINHPMLRGTNDIPVQLAQQMKQGTYKMLEGKYGELESATMEAQKALARGLKEGISNAVPNVSALNAKESELINALNVMERRALLEMNKNPVGLGFLASHPAAATAYMADKSSLFKSLLARMINAGSERVPEAAGMAVGAGFGSASGNSK